jgi:radical SAM superfamily enzyme YgiQ (UPF0313 family)
MPYRSDKEDLRLLKKEYYLHEPKVEGEIRVALGYPNYYSIGMANLGFHAVYSIFNSINEVTCQRFFLPKPLQQEELKRKGQPLMALESGRPIKDFDIVAFSISYEMDYLNVVRMFDLAGIPFLAEERDNTWPLVIFGGACTFINPEPLAPFADIIAIGEVEELIPHLILSIKSGELKSQLLKKLSSCAGFYIPSLYRIHYDNETSISGIEALQEAQFPVKRVWLKKLSEEHISYSSIITSEAAFGNILLVELCRGCTSGCRFCWAGFNYLPRRCNQQDAILRLAKSARNYTNKIGLVATSIGDYPGLRAMLDELINLDYTITLSSLRIDHLDNELVGLLKKGGLRSIAIAPETGSDNLRQSIHKRITNQEILEKTYIIFNCEILNVKLYYLIGLPDEKEEDIKAIVDLTEQIKKQMIDVGKKQGRIGKLTLSINCFIPKPHTPFQDIPLESEKSLKEKISFLKKALCDISNVDVSIMSFSQAQKQALLSRGDRKIAQFLIFMEEHNCGWKEALRRCEIDVDYYIHREITGDQFLAWNIIDNSV